VLGKGLLSRLHCLVVDTVHAVQSVCKEKFPSQQGESETCERTGLGLDLQTDSPNRPETRVRWAMSATERRTAPDIVDLVVNV